jgi:hypothetical protein
MRGPQARHLGQDGFRLLQSRGVGPARREGIRHTAGTDISWELRTGTEGPAPGRKALRD